MYPYHKLLKIKKVVNTNFRGAVASEESGRGLGSSMNTLRSVRDFSPLDTVVLWGHLSWGLALCITGCSGSLNSTRRMLLAPLFLMVTTKKCLQIWLCVPEGRERESPLIGKLCFDQSGNARLVVEWKAHGCPFVRGTS